MKLGLTFVLAACGASSPPDAASTISHRESDGPAVQPALTNQGPTSPAKDLASNDLDGDGKADAIGATFTGGAHCCYLVHVALSTGVTVGFPFDLDGGYVFGLDLSQPDHFFVADYDGDGTRDICAEIGTYNGEASPIPREWTQTFGITRNVVIISFARGNAVVRDYHRSSCSLGN